MIYLEAIPKNCTLVVKDITEEGAELPFLLAMNY